MNSDPKSRFWSGFLMGGCTAALAGALWLGLSRPPAALAQVPDSGAQRNAMIKELRESNRKLADITGLLREVRDDARKQKPDKQQTSPAKKRP